MPWNAVYVGSPLVFGTCTCCMLTFVSSLAKRKLVKDIQSYFYQTQRLSNSVSFTYIFYCGGECYRVRDCEVFACCFPEAFLFFNLCVLQHLFSLWGRPTRSSPSLCHLSVEALFCSSIFPSVKIYSCIILSFFPSFILSFYVCFFLPLILLFLFGGTEPSSGRSSPLSSRPATPTLSLTPKHFHVPGRSWSIISLFFFSREFFCSVSLPPFVHSNPLYNASMLFCIYCFDGRFCFPLMLRLSQIIQKFWSSCIYIAFPQIMIITDTICNLGGIKHVLLKLDLYFLIHRPRH